MIAIIEGPRGAGKSHLVNKFFSQNLKDDYVYYKWDFAEWVKELEIDESKQGCHYFSVGNIITILELADTVFKDKILVLDRSLISAYVWAMYRNRIDRKTLEEEFSKIMSKIYKNCFLIYVNRDASVSEFNRSTKDIFDKYENYMQESLVFEECISISSSVLTDSSIGNSMVYFNNKFDLSSELEFNKLLYSLSNK